MLTMIDKYFHINTIHATEDIHAFKYAKLEDSFFWTL